MADPVLIDADTVRRLVPPPDAAGALRDALLSSVEPAQAPARSAVQLERGQLLLMPAASAAHAGVKLVTVAAAPRAGTPRIAGVYVLFDAVDLHPVAVIDGAALTEIRTAAVSVLAVAQLAAPRASRLLVLGTGPQAWGHVQALRTVRPLQEVVAVGRDPGRCAEFVEQVRRTGLDARAGSTEDVDGSDLVVCATTARQPLFDGRRVRDDACVVAVGSHEPDARELDGTLLARAGTVAVEDVPTALREAGDVVLAVAEGALAPSRLLALAELVRGPARPPSRGPTVFKSVGMGWQDLAVAALVLRRATPAAAAAGWPTSTPRSEGGSQDALARD